MTPILDRYRLTPGLPPEAAPGQFLGVDATGNLWLLRWHRRGEWNALGYEEGIGADHPALRRGIDLRTLIVGHIMGPPLGQGPGIITLSAGFPPFSAGNVEGAAGEMSGTAADDRHPVGVRALGNSDEGARP